MEPPDERRRGARLRWPDGRHGAIVDNLPDVVWMGETVWLGHSTIWSAIGRGSGFDVYLPLVEAAAAPQR